MQSTILGACLLLLTAIPVSAHDDPIVTVRIVSNGFNVLDMDAVLGEISDSATLAVDRLVGPGQIQAWVKDEMDHDLRIQIVEMGTPEKTADGYTLAWTARFSREDWRRSGVQARVAANEVVIQNGRITRWTARLDPTDGAAVSAEREPSNAVVNTSAVFGATDRSAGDAAATGRSVASAGSPTPRADFPEILGIPVTFVGLAFGLLAAGGVGLFRRFR